MADARQPDQVADQLARQRDGPCQRRGCAPGGQHREFGQPLDLQMALQHVQQLGFDHRLVDEALHLGLRQPLRLVLERAGRDHDDGQVSQAGGTDLACGFPTVQVVHRDIEQHGVGATVDHALQALAPAGGFTDFEPQRDQQAGEHLALDGLVVHHQQRQPAADVAGDGPVCSARVARRRMARRVDLAQVQARREGAALAGHAFHAEFAAHQFGQQVGDGQAQAGAGVTGTPPGTAALEGQKDALLILRGDADAGVDHLDARDLAAVVEPQGHAAGVGEAHGVAQQVDEDLPEPLGVGIHVGRHAPAGLQVEDEPLGFGLRRNHSHQVVQELVHRQRGKVEPQAPGLDAGQIEQAVDQPVHVLAAAVDGVERGAACALHLVVLEQNLRVAQDAVERRAQFVGDAGDVARLGLISGFGQILGGLQRDIGALVSVDLKCQQLVLAVRLVLRHVAALAAQHHPPRAHGSNQRQQRKQLDERPLQQTLPGCVEHAFLVVHHAQDHRQQADHRQRDDRIVCDPDVSARRQRGGQHLAEQRADLLGSPRVGLATVVATRLQRAAQGADRGVVGRALGHVLGLERGFADRTGDLLARRPARCALPGEVVAPAGPPRQQRRHDHRGQQRDERGERLRARAHRPRIRDNGQHGGHQHGAQADGVDVVQVRALEFDVLRAPAHRLVDDQISHQRADPGNRDVAVQPEHTLQRLEDAQRHQHHRDQHVEHQPDHAPRVAVGQPGEEVGPRERAGIGVGQVDLDLRDHHEQGGDGQRPGRVVEHVGVAHQVHVGRVDRLCGRKLVLQRQECQEGAAEHLDHARDDPAGPGDQHCGPPPAFVRRRFFGQEAQVVDLLADLHDQRERHGGGRAEHEPVEAVAAGAAAHHAGEVGIHMRALEQYEQVGQREQRQPQRLGPELHARNQRDAVHHQRHDAQRRQQIAHVQGPAETQL